MSTFSRSAFTMMLCSVVVPFAGAKAATRNRVKAASAFFIGMADCKPKVSDGNGKGETVSHILFGAKEASTKGMIMDELKAEHGSVFTGYEAEVSTTGSLYTFKATLDGATLQFTLPTLDAEKEIAWNVTHSDGSKETVLYLCSPS